MARVAICPQCGCELLVPDAMEAAGKAKCPQCNESLQLDAIAARQLPAAVPVDQDDTKEFESPDISMMETWSPSIQEAKPEAPQEAASRVPA